MMQFSKTVNLKPLSGRQKRNKAAWVIGLIIILFYSIYVNPAESNITTCRFHEITGLDCPTCGISRSFYSLSKFNFNEAFVYHPLGPLLFIILGLLLIRFVIELLLNKELQLSIRILNYRWLYLAFAGLWLVVWIFRFF